MAEETKTPSRKLMGEPVQVIVEMRMPKSRGPGFALQMASGLTAATGFKLDTEYEPVPISPSSEEREMASDLEAKREEIILVRGKIEKDNIENLKKQPNVVNVWPDTKIVPFKIKESAVNITMAPKEAFGTCPIPPCDCEPGTPKGGISDVAKYLGVDKIWSAGYKGNGIVVGVVDGGITDKDRITGGEISGVIGGWPDADWGMKDLWGGHGNMCATDVKGMAPYAKIYDFRIADDTLSGTISNAIKAYEWAIQKHKEDGTPHVLSNSWGIFQKNWDEEYATNANHPFTKKVVEAIDEGILVLFAAGNCGETCPDSRCGSDKGPKKSIWGANGHPAVMTVGAATIEGKLVGYSSQGPASLDEYKPDFCSISHFKGYFNSDSGTSAACPIAAGVVALLKQYKPSYTQSAVKQDLKNTANNIGPDGWDQHSGSGIIQPAKIVAEETGEVEACDQYSKAASNYYQAYKNTGIKTYLCYYYYYLAKYYYCMYQQTSNQKHLCYYYYCLALYYSCAYQVTNNQKYLCYCYYYLASYYCCMYKVTNDKKYLCYCYYYVAMYYYCLYKVTWDQKYLTLYKQYAAAYKNCIQ